MTTPAKTRAPARGKEDGGEKDSRKDGRTFDLALMMRLSVYVRKYAAGLTVSEVPA